jgi:putative nucleotidyltransferase with HDIG domain
MKTVLFVDDDSSVLMGLKRMLHSMRREWKMAFAASASEALKYLAENQVDAIVTDIRMPGMDGVELLKKVRDDYPSALRIILSGQSDYSRSVESTRVAHQFLAKPCSSELLINAVQRNLLLEEKLHNAKVLELVAHIESLPSAPDLYVKINQLLESEDSDLASVAALIEKDMAMTAKVLQLVNSAFFGLPRTLNNVQEAVTFLGVTTIKTLILLNGIFSTLDKTENLDQGAIENIWKHSLLVGHVSAKVAAKQGLTREQQETAAVAGLLHDIGQYVLQVYLQPEYSALYQDSREGKQPIIELEKSRIGCTHAEVGAFLLSLWGLSSNIIEVVMFHHEPWLSGDQCFSSVSAVYFANHISDEVPEPLNQDYLEQVASMADYEKWQSLT